MSNPIIIPFNGDPISGSPTPEDSLIKKRFLAEFETEEDKAKARINLGVKSEVEIDEQLESLNTTTKDLAEKISKHLLDLKDPHNTIKALQKELGETIKSDGTTPFTKPQLGVAPITESHLTTKGYVDQAVQKYFEDNNIKTDHALFKKVLLYLNNYVKKDEIYNRNQTYSAEQINDAFNKVILKDASIPFEKPVSGMDPIAGSHLSTKRYVDKIYEKHSLAEDPHNVKQWILDLLKDYATKTDMAKVNEADVKRFVEIRVSELFSNLRDQVNPLNIKSRLEEWGYIKNDGTTPFISPQSGVDAAQDSDFPTLRQTRELVESITNEIKESFKILDQTNHWYTEGPVETTVGYVEDKTELPEKLTLQQIMDLIFYGKGINLIVPEYAEPGKPIQVCLEIKGSAARLKTVKVLQDGEVIWSGTTDDFNQHRICFQSKPLVNNPTKWLVDIEYIKGKDFVEGETKLVGGSFIGILDMFKHASGLQYSDYEKLVKEDPANNSKIIDGNLKEYTAEFDFESYRNKKQIYVAIPESQPDLEKITTRAQSFNVTEDGFNIVASIPLDVNGVSILYKVFVYREPIVALSKEEVVFKFAS